MTIQLMNLLFVSLFGRVAGHEGINGIVVNGHTGEIMTLLPHERAEAVRIAADELKGEIPVISGVSAEGTIEAIRHAKAVEEGWWRRYSSYAATFMAEIRYAA